MTTMACLRASVCVCISSKIGKISPFGSSDKVIQTRLSLTRAPDALSGRSSTATRASRPATHGVRIAEGKPKFLLEFNLSRWIALADRVAGGLEVSSSKSRLLRLLQSGIT